MTDSQFDTRVQEIVAVLDSPAEAIAATRRLASELGQNAVVARLNEMDQRHFYMMRTLASGFDVPDYQAEMRNTRNTLASLIFRLGHARRIESDPSMYYAQLRFQRLRPEENLESLISDYLAESERLRFDPAALTDSKSRTTLERIASDIFKHLWVQEEFDNELLALIDGILEDNAVAHYDRAMWLAAIGLGALESPESTRLELLMKAYGSNDETLSVIALCWLCMALGNASRGKYPVLVDEYLDRIRPADMASYLIERYRTRRTAALSASLQADAFSTFRKMHDSLEKSMRNDEIDIETLRRKFENPDSADMDNADFDVMKRMAEAQHRGDDVFYANIGNMRAYPFFNEISNWFIPFHTGASALADVTDSEGALVADTIGKMPMICDSDKYAVILSLAMTPANMRGKALEALSAQMGVITDSEDFDEAFRSTSNLSRGGRINNYVKNLYRFFRNFPQRRQFADMLSDDSTWSTVERHVLDAPDARDGVVELADMLFDTKAFGEARMAYEAVDRATLSLKQLKRLGYAVQMSGDATAATEIYRDIIADNPEDAWTAVRLADLLMTDSRFGEAVAVLEQITHTEPDNRRALAALAGAYTKAGKVYDALQTYYHLDYLGDNDDPGFKSHLAECLIYTGEFAEACAIYDALPDDATDTDSIAARAVARWTSGDRSGAVESLREAMRYAAGGLDRGDYAHSVAAAVRRIAAGLRSHQPDTYASMKGFEPLIEIFYYDTHDSDFGRIL